MLRKGVLTKSATRIGVRRTTFRESFKFLAEANEGVETKTKLLRRFSLLSHIYFFSFNLGSLDENSKYEKHNRSVL